MSPESVLRTVQVQHGNAIMPSDLLFLDVGTIASKFNCVYLVSPPILEKLSSLPRSQDSMLTARRNKDSNFDTLNCFPNSETTNEELSVILDLDNNDEI